MYKNFCKTIFNFSKPNLNTEHKFNIKKSRRKIYISLGVNK